MSHDLPASFDGDSRDPLRRMRLYRLAEELAPDAWSDSQKLTAEVVMHALGSVRESMSWYRAGKPVLGQVLINERLERLEEMRRLLLAIIPRERARGNKRL